MLTKGLTLCKHNPFWFVFTSKIFQFTFGELKTAVEDDHAVLVKYKNTRIGVYFATGQYLATFRDGINEEVTFPFLHDVVTVIDSLSFEQTRKQ